MKKLTLLFSILFFSQFAKAQGESDFSVNVLNALFYEFNAGYEYGIKENVSLGVFGGYVYGFPGAQEYSKFTYFGPEFRYYVLPNRGIDRFYFGVYSRYKDGYTTGYSYEGGELLSTGEYVSYSSDQNIDFAKLAIGLTIGGKWVSQSGFIFGIQGGLGRNLFANYDAPDFKFNQSEYTPGSYYSGSDYANIDSEYWDFRISFSMGWRIGK